MYLKKKCYAYFHGGNMKTCKECGQLIPQEKIGKTIKIPELKIEIETSIHNKNECLPDIKIPKGWRLPTYFELQTLRNNKKYIKKLHLDDTWEFVEQPDNISKENNYVVRFGADSDWAFLFCDRDPRGSYSELGVRFCRSLRR